MNDNKVVDITPRIQQRELDRATDEWIDKIMALPHVYDELIGAAGHIAHEMTWLIDNGIVAESLLQVFDNCEGAIADMVRAIQEECDDEDT
jgi:hypothetical protein